MKRRKFEHGAIYHAGHPEVIANWRKVRSEAARRGWQTRRAQAKRFFILRRCA